MLTDGQWAVPEPLFQEERTGAGRSQVHTEREVLNGILWGFTREPRGRIARQISIAIHLLQKIQQVGERRKVQKNSGGPGEAHRR